MNTINPLKTVLCRRSSCAGMAWVALPRFAFAMLFCAAVPLTRATPLVNNNAGSYTDDYANNLGIVSAPGVHITSPGTVALISPNTSGNYVTVQIVPTSFDAWGQLTIGGNYGAPGDLMAKILSTDGIHTYGPYPLPITLSSVLSVSDYPGIQVQVFFTKSGAVDPIVNSLQVTWHPISQVLLDKQGPSPPRCRRATTSSITSITLSAT